MQVIVKKFGGSSVGSAEKIKSVAKIITDTYQSGKQVVVVVSAMADTTDDLIEKSKEINTSPSPRELDVLLSTGEQVSISLLAMAIDQLGFPVISLTGWQIGLKTNSIHSYAKINHIINDRIKKELDQNKIVIIAGFQGIDENNDITTLGRGGSDTSAVAIAACLHADQCIIYTDVDGIYTSNPRIVKNTRHIPKIDYDMMLELASNGASVLHDRSVEIAKKYGVTILVKSSQNSCGGTIVSEVNNTEQLDITGIADNDAIVLFYIKALPYQADALSNLFSILEENQIHIDTISITPLPSKLCDVIIVVPKEEKDRTLYFLEYIHATIAYQELIVNDMISKISIIGTGIKTHLGIIGSVFDILNKYNENCILMTSNEINLSVIVHQKNSNQILNSIHDAFIK